jgi:hypothetical protein
MRPVLAAALAVAALTAPATSYADEASKTAKIEEMFRITKVDRLQDQVMDQMKSALGNLFNQPGVPAEAKAARKELEDEVWAIIRKRVSFENMKGDFVRIYSENLTEPELDSILAFYKTPGGVALLEKMPVLLKKGMEIGQAQMKDLGPEIQQAVEKFVERHKGK